MSFWKKKVTKKIILWVLPQEGWKLLKWMLQIFSFVILNVLLLVVSKMWVELEADPAMAELAKVFTGVSFRVNIYYMGQ